MLSLNTEHLYQKLSAQLKYFIGQRVNDPMIVEDILHDVFIKVHNNIETVKDESKIENWIFQITRNAIIDYYRKNRMHIYLEEEIISVEQDKNENDSHINASIGLTAFVEALPEIYREAILFTEYEGLTQKQLAERLGISLSGAKSRVQRGRKMLKDLLFQCCHFEYDIYGTVIDYCKVCCCCSESNKY